ncbi:MAG: arsenic efflux protein [Butyrivibrio sp.]|nr:arsenic efflux protein [Butyrivibrio sp.]
MDLLIDVIKDTGIDALKILPFLFVTYLLMETLEHHAGEHTQELVEKSGHFGPLLGGLFGVIPQCGFSAAASNLYAGRVITLGTLIAIYLSTSDEMLPLLISAQVPLSMMLYTLLIKAVIGIIAGFIIDFIIHRYHKIRNMSLNDPLQIDALCEKEHCHCEEDESNAGIFKSALVHTVHIFIYIIIITFILNTAIALIGEDTLSGFLSGAPVLSHIIAGIIGLIPNCAASIIITELYLEGMITFGSMMSGLLVGAGIGLLVLFRVNPKIKANINITIILYFIGTISGLLIDLLGIAL